MTLINNVIFGNPTYEQNTIKNLYSFLDSSLEEIKFRLRKPLNSSEQTKEEIEKLIEVSNTIVLKHNEHIIQRYINYDLDMITYFKDGLTSQFGLKKAEIEKLINEIVNDCYPIITKLKYYYQRPRPYQLAAYLDLPLYPYKSYSVDSPSFPSGHAFMGKIVCEVIGRTYYNVYGFMQQVSEDFNNSRQYLALHYPSDVKAGVDAATIILSNKEFIKKYKL